MKKKVNLGGISPGGGILVPANFLLLISLLITVVFMVSCEKDPEILPEIEQTDNADLKVAGHYFIACCNMANSKIEVYNSSDYTSFDQAGSLNWSWKPTTGLGYTTSEINAWAHPYGCIRRECNNWSGTTEVGGAVCRDGLCTIFRFVGGTKGQKLWAKAVGSTEYPHAIDVLPNGNCAIAGRRNGAGGWIRVYASSQGPTNGTYANYNMDWAHGVLWDPLYNRLWAIGEVPGGPTDILVALIVGGTDANPTLTEDMSMRAILPGGGGHDLAPFYYDTNKLWITTLDGVYTYDKTTKTFTPSPYQSFRSNVKSVSNQPIGDIVEAKPNPTLCTLNTWCTIKAEFYDGTTGAWIYNRTRTGAAFYKTDVWWWRYQ